MASESAQRLGRSGGWSAMVEAKKMWCYGQSKEDVEDEKDEDTGKIIQNRK